MRRLIPGEWAPLRCPRGARTSASGASLNTALHAADAGLLLADTPIRDNGGPADCCCAADVQAWQQFLRQGGHDFRSEDRLLPGCLVRSQSTRGLTYHRLASSEPELEILNGSFVCIDPKHWFAAPASSWPRGAGRESPSPAPAGGPAKATAHRPLALVALHGRPCRPRRPSRQQHSGQSRLAGGRRRVRRDPVCGAVPSSAACRACRPGPSRRRVGGPGLCRLVRPSSLPPAATPHTANPPPSTHGRPRLLAHAPPHPHTHLTTHRRVASHPCGGGRGRARGG